SARSRQSGRAPEIPGPSLCVSVPILERRPIEVAAECEGFRAAEGCMPGEFSSDIQAIRQRARAHMEEGAVTAGYKADRQEVMKVLNEVLATEIVCVLRYKRHHFMARGIHAQSVAQEFLKHAGEEQGHADQVAQRIVQLGGEPNFNPEGLTQRSHAQYIEGETIPDMLREDLVAERIAVESY